MTDRIRKFQILNMQIFSVLEKYLGRHDQMIQNEDRAVIHISPPTPDSAESEVDHHPSPVYLETPDEVDA